jgi:hypothetical protein
MTRTQVEQEFLNCVDDLEGFFLRKDGKIEREVNDDETWTKTIKGEYYDRVEIVSKDDYLDYIRDEIEDAEDRRRRAVEEEAAN